MRVSFVLRREQVCPTVDEDIAQLRPILVVVAINYERGFVTRLDIAHAPELVPGDTLGFLVEWSIEACPVKGIADGDDMRAATGIGCGEMRNSLRKHKR